MSQDSYELLPSPARNLCMMLEQLDSTVDAKSLSGILWLAETHEAMETSRNKNAKRTLQRIKEILGDHKFEELIGIGKIYLNVIDEAKVLMQAVTKALNQASLEQRKAALEQPINPEILAKLQPDPIALDDLLNALLPLFADLTLDQRDKLLSQVTLLMSASTSTLGEEGYALITLESALTIPKEESPNHVEAIERLNTQIEQLKQTAIDEKQDVDGTKEQIKALSKELANEKKYQGAIDILKRLEEIEIASIERLDLSLIDEKTKKLLSSIDVKKSKLHNIGLEPFIAKEGVSLEGTYTLRDCFEPELSEQLDALIKKALKKLKFKPSAFSKADASMPDLVTFIQEELKQSGLLLELMREKLDEEKDPELFSFLYSELEAEIKDTLKNDLEDRLHPVSVFRENKWRITGTSVLTALLLADLITIALLSSSLLWLKIALPIFVAAVVAGLTLFVGLTNQISPKTKQTLAQMSMVFIGAVATFGSLMTLGIFAKHSTLLTPALPLLPGAPALVSTVSIMQVMLVFGIVLLAAAALWQLHLASEELGMMSKAEHLLENSNQIEQKQQESALVNELAWKKGQELGPGLEKEPVKEQKTVVENEVSDQEESTPQRPVM